MQAVCGCGGVWCFVVGLSFCAFPVVVFESGVVRKWCCSLVGACSFVGACFDYGGVVCLCNFRRLVSDVLGCCGVGCCVCRD